ncbi:MAG: hypothetical protein JNK54_04630 [Elusimicrobia bacterium]|jgi:hypothetical protein|nr:hypothetical protein [Elusimicrobiota bacterium]
MKHFKSLTLILMGAFFVGAVALPVRAETPVKGEKKAVGILIKVDVAEDGASAVATLKVRGKKVEILVTDELTLNKFEIKKIKVGDEIRTEYNEKDGVRSSVQFVRTAGC